MPHTLHLAGMLPHGPSEQKHHIALHHQIFPGSASQPVQDPFRAHLKHQPLQPFVLSAAHQQRPFVSLAVEHLPEEIGNTVIFHQQAVKGIPKGASLDDDVHRNRALITGENRLADLRRDDDEIPFLHPHSPVLPVFPQIEEKASPQGINDFDEVQAVIEGRHIPVMQQNGNLAVFIGKAVLLGQQASHEKGRFFLQLHIPRLRSPIPLNKFLPVPHHTVEGLRIGFVQTLCAFLKIPKSCEGLFHFSVVHFSGLLS